MRAIGSMAIGAITAAAGFPVYRSDTGINWVSVVILVASLVLFNVIMSAIEKKSA